jgi:hypothetical protein
VARPRSSRPTGKTCPKCGFDDWQPRGTCGVCNRRRVLRWKRANTASYLLSQARGRAKKSGTPFNLVEADIVIPTHCPVLGIALEAGDTGGRHEGKDNSPSLDRLRPELGYTRGNVVVISYLANSIKHTATGDQVLAVGRWLKSMNL